MSISKQTYLKLKDKYKQVASWTLWDEPPANAKTHNKNVDSFNWMENENALLKRLNSKYIFVALNGSDVESVSRNHEWGNFHSANPRQTDYRLRYATVGTAAEGSYITDLFKDVPSDDDGIRIDRTNSHEVLKYLKKHPEKIADNIEALKEEIGYISKNPILIALGKDSYKYLREYLSSDYVIEKIPHYAVPVKLDDYKTMLKDVLKKNGD